jgi:hypothetical protein
LHQFHREAGPCSHDHGKLCDIGGNGFGFEGVGAVQQAGTRFQAFYHALIACQADVDDIAAYGAQMSSLDQARYRLMFGNLDDESAAERRDDPAFQSVQERESPLVAALT